MQHTRIDRTPPANRRDFMRGAVGLGLAAASLPGGAVIGASRAEAQQGAGPRSAGAVITRAIPFTNEALPVIGLGTFLTFDVMPGQKRDHLREVIDAIGRRVRGSSTRRLSTEPARSASATSQLRLA
jgi:hypothetical protein